MVQDHETCERSELKTVVAERGRVLVVDDDEAICSLLADILTRSAFDVSTAVDAEAAWQRMSSGDIDLVISDVRMPGKSGTELMRMINERYPLVPVILMTGMPDVEAAVECIKDGAFDYLVKPIDVKKLRERVRAALREGRRPPDAARTSASEPGSLLAGYRVIRLLGEGNVGVVFLVQDPEDTGGKRYALKIIKQGAMSKLREGKLLLRFLQEGEAASQITHPNVIRSFEYGLSQERNIPYLVMEYFVAPTLADSLAGLRSTPWEDRARIVRQAALGLDAIHARGICHRDIKPANIMVTDSGLNVKISDFGLALLPDSECTNPENLVGTPAYMAPEAFLSSHVGAAADIFSLGVVAYELWLGQRPFPGKTIFALAREIPEAKPVRPRRLAGDFPPRLEALLAQMLRKDPEQRPEASGVIQALDAYLADGPGADNGDADGDWAPD